MYSSSREESFSKEKLIGMQVIDGRGYLLGTVKDIGFTIGKMDISLIIQDKMGETKEMPWNTIQAVGDFVLVKSQPEARTAEVAPTQAVPQQTVQPQTMQQQQTPEHVCQTCYGPLTYIPQYQRWYCYKCKKYA
jgi:sporulation protein YlmC with PRC-barrel domain